MSDAGTAPLYRVFDWIKGRERILLCAGIALQLLVLVAMIGSRVLPLATGETVLVRVVPVDPRDFFRGDYVILSYEFSRVDPIRFDDPRAPDSRSSARDWQGTTIFIPLEPEADGRHWKASGPALLDRPATGKYLQGTITGHHRATFGIESYFVQEGEGKAYEKAVRSRKLSAEISLTKTGKAALKRLVYDGK